MVIQIEDICSWLSVAEDRVTCISTSVCGAIVPAYPITNNQISTRQ